VYSAHICITIIFYTDILKLNSAVQQIAELLHKQSLNRQLLDMLLCYYSNRKKATG